jgi:hypothetical protein
MRLVAIEDLIGSSSLRAAYGSRLRHPGIIVSMSENDIPTFVEPV